LGVLGMGLWPQPPIPNPQSPIPNPQSPDILIFIFNLRYLNYFNLKIFE